jgi:hypothetical protein
MSNQANAIFFFGGGGGVYIFSKKKAHELINSVMPGL